MDFWSEGFQEPSAEFPDKIVDKYIQSFEKATGGLVSLVLREMSDIERVSTELKSTNFRYRVVLTSRILRGYSFKVMSFGYDVTMFPVFVLPEEGIAEEVGVSETALFSGGLKIEDEDTLRKLIEAVFKCPRFRSTVGGLLKVARAKSNEP